MKKVILGLAMILVAFVSTAQEVKFGAKAGLNLSDISGDDAQDNNMKVGFHVGGFAHIGISDKFAFQPELLFSTQGTKIDGTDGDPDLDFNTSYINVPLLAKFYVTEGLNIQVGPQVGLLLSGEFASSGVSFDVKDNMKSVDFSGVFGLGYELEKINFGARYILGLTDVFDNGDILGSSAGTPAPDLQNSTIQVFVGYSF